MKYVLLLAMLGCCGVKAGSPKKESPLEKGGYFSFADDPSFLSKPVPASSRSEAEQSAKSPAREKVSKEISVQRSSRA